MATCSSCPRQCHAQRGEQQGQGYCGMGFMPRVARAALHRGEEPIISGTRGSGAIFFSGCALRCVYCQNTQISRDGLGWPADAKKLGRIFQALRTQGSHNINLVSASHFLPTIIEALKQYPPGIPVVYNSSGYETPEAIDALSGVVDVFLPDLKYLDCEGAELSGARDYPQVACAAILRMCRHTGAAQYDEAGMLLRGTMVRHLVLPGRTLESIQVLNWLYENLPEGTPISLMGQYTPYGDALCHPALSRPVPKAAYRRVCQHMRALGLEGFVQASSSSGTAQIPIWDGTGVIDTNT